MAQILPNPRLSPDVVLPQDSRSTPLKNLEMARLLRGCHTVKLATSPTSTPRDRSV